MKSTMISLSDLGLREAVGALELSGHWLLPEPSGQAEDRAKARQEWIDSGLVQQGMDGSLKAQPEVGRMLYDLVHGTGALQLRRGGLTILYVCGPVDALRLEQTMPGGQWQLALRSFREMRWWTQRDVADAEDGVLTSLSQAEGEPQSDSLDGAADLNQRLELLARHLDRCHPS